MTTAKWMKKLTKRELTHLADGSSTGKPTINSLKANIANQRKLDIQCFECESIARKLSVQLPAAGE